MASFFFLLVLISVAAAERIPNSYEVTLSAESDGTLCFPKWYPCTDRRYKSDPPCCSGWKCVQLKNAPYFGVKRCEPPVLVDREDISVPAHADSIQFAYPDGSDAAVLIIYSPRASVAPKVGRRPKEKRCQPPVRITSDASVLVGSAICHSRRSRGYKCPASCGFDPDCVQPCRGPKNRFSTSKCCAKGWRCVRAKSAETEIEA